MAGGGVGPGHRGVRRGDTTAYPGGLVCRRSRDADACRRAWRSGAALSDGAASAAAMGSVLAGLSSLRAARTRPVLGGPAGRFALGPPPAAQPADRAVAPAAPARPPEA